jgi:small subunit ribosomal protein S8
MSTQISTDPIADMLTRVRNAVAIRRSEVEMPYSTMKASIAKLLKENNFIDEVRVDGEKTMKTLTLIIHDEHTNPRITEITRMSTPGRRLYARAQEIRSFKRGRGMMIVSTSKGLMTDADARSKRIGGELICKVY